MLFSLRMTGREHLPRKGPAILAMNHQSFLDPPLAGSLVPGDIFFLARRNLMKPPLLHWLLPRLNVIPVDLDGQDRTALKQVLRLLKQGERILLFPEGTRSKDGSLLPGKPGLGLIAAKSGAPIIPMRISGANKALPRSGGRLRLCPVLVAVGEPLQIEEIAGEADRDRYQRISDRIMEAIAALPAL